MTRSYESNGPDVKIRGSAQQIAEKYATLARDAQGSGDRVMAENYLQHAEHYNRIIAAAQAQLQVQVQRDYRDDYEDDEEQDAPGHAQPERVAPGGSGPQPVISGTPAEVALSDQAPASDASRNEEKPAAEEKAEQPKRRARRPRKTAKAEAQENESAEPTPAIAGEGDPELAATGS